MRQQADCASCLVGTASGRIEVISAAGFEDYFREVAGDQRDVDRFGLTCPEMCDGGSTGNPAPSPGVDGRVLQGVRPDPVRPIPPADTARSISRQLMQEERP